MVYGMWRKVIILVVFFQFIEFFLLQLIENGYKQSYFFKIKYFMVVLYVIMLCDFIIF